MKALQKIRELFINSSSVIDLAGAKSYLVSSPTLLRRERRTDLNGFRQDAEALRGDWGAVGRDMRAAMRAFKRSAPPEAVHFLPEP